MDEVTYAAEKFLASLISQGLNVPEVDVQIDPNDTPAHYEDGTSKAFIDRIDAEFKAERYDADDVLEEVVLKRGHQFLYADSKWTYDIRLAKRFRYTDAERIIRHFDEGTSFVPAPAKPNL